MVIFVDITEVLSGNAPVSREGPSHPTEKVRQPTVQRLTFFSLFGDAKVESFYVLNKVLIRLVNHRILLISSYVSNDACLQIRFLGAVLDSIFFRF